MAYPRFVRSRSIVKARRTSGDITLNSTSWANVDTGLDLVLNEVQAGDEIIYGINGLVGAEAVTLYLDLVTVVSGTVTNSFGTRGAPTATSATGGFFIDTFGKYFPLMGVSGLYTVTAGDLVDGSVTVRLRYRTGTAANKTLLATTDSPLDVWALNMGPAQ